MTTRVYVDGFNLYYGSLKNTPYQWLDLSALCKLMLPTHTVVAIKYFTALISDRSDQPGQANDQQTYLRALSTLPNLTIHLGHFLTHAVTMRLADPPATGPAYARVIKTEEKGSDVNLASHLLHDAHMDRFSCAVVISNDSDLLEPVRLVRYELGKKVGLLNPHKRPSRTLLSAADFMKPIRQGVLAASQFPENLVDDAGRFHRPYGW